jgi:hypothetical protein
MDLERIEIELRPRGPWEAADLGCLLVRRWPAALYGGWLVTAVPVFALVTVLLRAQPGWVLVVVWWFKPLYERLPMWLLSQRIFGDRPTLRDARSNGRALLADLPAMLTYRRLAPARSFDAPVAVLEGLSGRKRSARVALLHRTAGSQAFWLTVIGVHVESFIVLGVVVLAFMLVPNDVELDWTALLNVIEQDRFAWITNLLYLGAFALVGPVYAAAGFTLYLNRRIELEGWDIELKFRRLTARLGRSAAGLLLLVPLCLVIAPRPVDAAVDTSATDESRSIIDSVLADPQFNEVHTVSVPEFLKRMFEPSQPTKPTQPPEIGWLGPFVKIVAAIGEVLLWVVVAVVAGVLLYRLWRAPWFREADPERDLPRRIVASAGVDVDIPADVVGAANDAWVAGQPRRALALLYRGALAALLTHHGCRFREGDTEGDCLRRARGVVAEPVLAGLVRLTETWQRLAYAHRRPDDEEFAQLCAAWSVFQPGRNR